MQININAMLWTCKINILAIIVSIVTVIFDITFIYFSAFCFPMFICKIPFKILPPSNGYIGNRLNITIKKFVYIIVSALNNSIFKFNIMSMTIKFVIGPASATNIFLISCNYFLLKILLIKILFINNINNTTTHNNNAY